MMHVPGWCCYSLCSKSRYFCALRDFRHSSAAAKCPLCPSANTLHLRSIHAAGRSDHRQTDLGKRHHFGVRAAALHGADEQATIRGSRPDVFAPAGAACEGGGPGSEIESGRRQAAIVALQAVLLQHRFDLGEEIVRTSAVAVREQRAGGDDKNGGKKTQEHLASLTMAWETIYTVFVQSYADA